MKSPSKLILPAAACLVPSLASAQQTQIDQWLVVPLAGLGILFILGIIALSLFSSQRESVRRARLIEKFLESGQPVPPEILRAPRAQPRISPQELATISRRRGVALLGWGAGISLVLYIGTGEPRAAAWGLLFLFLAIASFINARFFSGDRAPPPSDASKSSD